MPVTLTGDTSTAFNIVAATADRLEFTTQPSNAAAGATLSTVTISIKDSFGNVNTSANNVVTLGIGNNPGGGTLLGSTSAAAVNGVATFTNLAIQKSGSAYNLIAVSGVLSAATSSAFNITAGSATQIGFIVQPTNIVAGDATNSPSPITPSVQLAVQDQYGNTVTFRTDNIIVTFGSNPGGSSLTSGTPANVGNNVTVAAVAGVATFVDLNINKAGSGYTLSASTTGLTSSTSNAFDITPDAADSLGFVQQPTATEAGAAIFPAVTVEVRDPLLNRVTTATDSITLTLSAGTGILSGATTVSAMNGLAVFVDLSINLTGAKTLTAASGTLTSANSSSFNILTATSNRLAFTMQPSDTAAGANISPSVQVRITDSLGNTQTSATNTITLAVATGAGTLQGTTAVAAVNGVATFSNIRINLAGSGYSLQTTATGLLSRTSSIFTINEGAASTLAFAIQPTNTVAGVAISSVSVSVKDAVGNVVSSSTASITMSIGTNPSSGTLSGTKTVAAVNGVATFSDLNIDKAGTGYTLSAAAAGLTSGTSNTFNITFAPAAILILSGLPATVSAGVASGVTVEAQDAFGNRVTGYTGTVSFTSNDPFPAVLPGAYTFTTGAASDNGIHTFVSGVTLKTAGVRSVTVSDGTRSASQTGITVVAASASKLGFTFEPMTTEAGASIFPAVEVAIQDAFGNTVTSATTTVSLAPSSATLGGNTSAAAANGVAVFPGIFINTVNTYTLTASTLTGLTSAVSSSFNITASSTRRLAFSTQPTNAVATASLGNIQVQVLLANGSVDTGAADTITLTIANNPGGGALSGINFAAASSGVATIGGLSINKIGAGYTLQATAAGVLSTTSSTFNITPGAAATLNVTGIASPVTAGTARSVTVEPRDSQGNRVTNYTGTVGFTSSDAQATLPSNYTFLAGDNGIHTFASGVVFKTAATQSITATDSVSASVTGSQSNITVTPASANKLIFAATPANTAYGAAISPAVLVRIQDTFGNTVVTATNVVTIGLGANPSAGTLSGTNIVAAVAGTATSSTLSIDKAGIGYTLTASGTGLTGATSGAFNITDAVPPTINSPITPSVATGTEGQSVQFTCIASDNQTITYLWDFGDGSNATTTATSLTHTFTSAGVFTITVVAMDSSGNTVTSTLSFTVLANGGGGPGVAGNLCDGLNPITFSLLQVTSKLKFPSSLRKDGLSFKSVIQLNDGFNPLGQEVKWEIGGIIGATTLDAKGNSPTASSVKVSVKFKKPAKGLPFTAAPGKLTISLKGQDLSLLQLAGVPTLNSTSASKTGAPATIKICVVLTSHQAYHDESKSGIYKSVKDKGASFSAK